MHAAAMRDSFHEPQLRRRPLIPNNVLGTLLFVFTEVMLFAGLISAHTIVSAGATEWPPAGQPRLPFGATLFNTVALVASGLVLGIAHFGFRKQSSLARTPLLVALLLGSLFVGLQGREWVALIGEGLTLRSSTYGAFFYTIVGLHAIHALGAILALGWAYARLRAGRLTASQLMAVEVFWYFVVLLWPVLFVQLYL